MSSANPQEEVRSRGSEEPAHPKTKVVSLRKPLSSASRQGRRRTPRVVPRRDAQATPAEAAADSTVRDGNVYVQLYALAGDADSTDSVTNHGGPRIQTVPLELVFWGAAWNQATTVPSTNDVATAVSQILTGPYPQELTQYGFTNGWIRGSTIVTNPAPPSPYKWDDVGNMIWGLIDQGQFPEPDDTGGYIYFMVFMAPGTTGPSGEAGAHGDMTDYDFPWDVDEAWLGYVQTGDLNFITEVFSHELVEGITNPEPDNASWTMDRTLNGGNEIGDACSNTRGWVDDTYVQGYWSQKHRSCVIPYAWAPAGTWAELYTSGDNLKMLGVGRNADGRLEVFGVNSAGLIFHTWQTTPGGDWIGSWSEMFSAGDNLAMLDVASNQDGRLEVFGVNSAGLIFHTWQTTPGGDWIGSWSEMFSAGDNLAMLDVASNQDGRLEVFGVNSAGLIFHTWQTTPGGDWIGSWSEMFSAGDNLAMLDVASNQDGRLEVFGVNSAGLIFHTWQTTPGGDWIGSWSEMFSAGDNLKMLRVGRNADGRLEVFGVNSAGLIFHTWQTTPGGDWIGSWSEMFSAGDHLKMLRVGRNADGRLEVFGVNSAGLIFHTWQTTPGGDWIGSWSEMFSAGDNLAMLDVASNQDGRLEVFGVNSAGLIFHTWQTTPGGKWVDQ